MKNEDLPKQYEFSFCNEVEKEQIRKENHLIIKRAIKLQEYQGKFPRFNRYLRYRIAKLLEKVR